MNAVAVLDELDMLLGYGVGGMKRHRPRHAILVVHGHPSMAVERVRGVGRNEGLPRHDPLSDPPVIVAGIRIAPRADEPAAGGVEDGEGGLRGFRELRARGVPVEGVAGQVPAVQERNMAGIDAALDRLQVVALLPPLGGDTMRRGQMHPLEVRQRRLFLRRPHVGPDDSAQFHARVGLELDALAHAALFRLRGQVPALAVHVVLPPVVRAAQPALLVAPEPQRHAAVGAELLDHADSSLGIAEGNQLLSQQFRANRRAVALRQLPVEQRGYPVAPEQLAHRRAGARAGEEYIHLFGQHGRITVSVWVSTIPPHRSRTLALSISILPLNARSLVSSRVLLTLSRDHRSSVSLAARCAPATGSTFSRIFSSRSASVKGFLWCPGNGRASPCTTAPSSSSISTRDK